MDARKEFDKNRYKLKSQLPSECGNCGSAESTDIHHIVPIARGGTNRISNLVTLCRPCHDAAHGMNRSGNHKEAQAAGIEKAKAEGKYQGRPIDVDLHKRVKELLKNGMGVRPTARHAKCSTTTVIKIKEFMSAEFSHQVQP